jgi:hypothetical protein
MAFTAYSPRGAELDRNHFRQGRSGDRSGSSTVGRRKPRQAFLRKKLRRRYKPSGVIECERADMKMRVRRAFTFARQGGPASCAEAAQPAGRRIESGYLALGHGPSVTPECDENGNRRTAMLAAALAMAPRHRRGCTPGDKSHRAAKTPALNLVAHLAIPSLRAPQAIACIRKSAIIPFGKSMIDPPHIETMHA